MEYQLYTHKKKDRQLAAILVLLSIILIFAIHMQPSEAKQAVIFAEQYIEYTVRPGDTLWAIARIHRGRRDIRDVVWELQEVNQITPVIHPGQVLWVPVGGN